VLLYWSIGREILRRQRDEGWGAKIVERLAKDLRAEFPDMQGLSRTNLLYMRAFAEAWPEEGIVQQAVGQIPWGHNLRILDLVKDPQDRLWYVEEAVRNGWSRNILVMQIESGLHRRQGKAVTNFRATLPQPESDLAPQLIKDPYNFDFLTLTGQALERDLERGLLAQLRQFHLKLRCFVVIDLKMTPFKPEYTGKMNFYLSAVDDLFRHPDDKRSIGLILCKTKNGVVAEYAVRDIAKPLGVAEFRLLETLPEQFKGTLPAIEDIEAELARAEQPAD
jgi:predicted nuclease of restriction endonuclease-like (RecB) superfamily